MLYNKIGNSELKVSQIGLGAMSLTQGQQPVNQYIVDQSLDMGINYLDTADLYDKGENEILIGKLLQGDRDKWILASKVGNKWNQTGEGWTWDPSKSNIISSVEKSLSRLKTDYLDLYQLHGGTIDDPFDDIIDAFETLASQGKIRYYGVSSIRPNVFQKYIAQSNIISNMMQFSLLDQRPKTYLAEFEKSNVSIISRGALAQGQLVGKTAGNYLGYTQDQVLQVQRKADQVCRELGITTLAYALKFPLLHGVVCSSLIGIRTKAQINELKSALLDMESLSKENYLPILNILPQNEYTQHRF